MLPFSNRKRYLWAEQTADNTDAVDANLLGQAADTVFQQVMTGTITPEGHNDTPERHQWSASGVESTFVKHRAGVELELPMTLSVGDNAAAPYYAPVLKAANLSETLSQASGSGTDTAVYRPSTSQVSKMTLYQFHRVVDSATNARLRYATDVVLSPEFSLSNGEEATISFSGQGYFNEVITPERAYFNTSGELVLDKDGNSITPTNQKLADKNPVIPRNMTVTLVDEDANNITSLAISEFTLDLGWSQDAIDTVTATEGHMDHYNTRGSGEAVTGGFNLLDADPTDFDHLLDAYKEAQQVKFTAGLEDLRATNTEKVEFFIPKMQFEVPEEGENGNLASYQFNFRATKDTSASPDIGTNALEGDNDFQITYSYIS